MKTWSLLLFFTVAACSGAGSKSPATADGQAGTAVAIRVAKTTEKTVERSVEISGSLLAPDDSTIGAEVDGRISELRVDLGDKVKQGDVLARINPQEYRLHMEQAEAVRAQTEANLKRVAGLAKTEMVAKRELDDAQAAAAQARAAADLAAKKYHDTNVRAPFAGAVARRAISLGEYVKAGQALFQIVVLQPLKLSGEVPERHITALRPGSPVDVTVDAFVGEIFSGKVTRVSPVVNPTSRAFTVEALIDNSQGRLKPGVFAKAQVSLGTSEPMIVVPETALSVFAGLTKVFVIEGDVAREKTVEVDGHLPGGLVTLRKSEVRAGETVAVAGVGRLADGVKVAIR